MEEKTKDRRTQARTPDHTLVRVRPLDPRFPPEVGTTSNISATGLYFLTSAGHYLPGMEVYVMRDFRPGAASAAEETGAIVRVDRLETGQCGVAIHIFRPADSMSR